MNIKILNWIVFGSLMLWVFAIWCMAAFAIIVMPVAGIGMIVAALMATNLWISHIKESLKIQELNRREKMREQY